MQNALFNELWSAYYRVPPFPQKVRFVYGKVELKQKHLCAFETVHYHFINRNNSTRFFDDSMLNHEYMITDDLTVFYSESKEKCIKWLEEKRKTLLENSKSLYERVCASKIEQEDD